MSRGRTRKSGSWSGTQTTGTRVCRTWIASRSTTYRRFRPSSDRHSSRARSTMHGVTAAAFNQSVIQAFWTNMKRKPLADPRVRRAIHLAMDRPALVDVVKDTAPMQIGGFVYPFHPISTPKAELEKRLGYQKDVKPAVQE